MKSKTLLIVTASVLLAALLVGGVYAAVTFMHGDTDELTNSLVADDDNTPSVSEKFEDGVKSDVKVTVPKTGYSVYVRAMIVVNWQKIDDSETYPEVTFDDSRYVVRIGAKNRTDEDSYDIGITDGSVSVRQCGTAVFVVHLQSGTGSFVRPVQVGGGIGDRRPDLVKVSADGFLQTARDTGGHAACAEISDQFFTHIDLLLFR